eukprot:NODE_7592_length_559_cov_1.888235_g6565_i0.p3 GENE.NODE_7592_length_559_cov_1.888235_g6565_i0~~NODE_7592_length_559_cov_1.888235_g6565_i0.p3  ORF type:complete len:96 (-),score=0.71 NODE_7592_length_559_cov_1.888235_g6565_i0:99-386(-)
MSTCGSACRHQRRPPLHGLPHTRYVCGCSSHGMAADFQGMCSLCAGLQLERESEEDPNWDGPTPASPDPSLAPSGVPDIWWPISKWWSASRSPFE